MDTEDKQRKGLSLLESPHQTGKERRGCHGTKADTSDSVGKQARNGRK